LSTWLTRAVEPEKRKELESNMSIDEFELYSWKAVRNLEDWEVKYY
jgi:hypothetical protein